MIIKEGFHNNGKLAQRYTTTKEGIPHGLYQNWSRNGNKSFEYTYEYGTLNGIFKAWFIDGRPYEFCYFNMGIYEGEMVTYEK